MTPLERLADLVAQLVDGWNERVEFAVEIRQHTAGCDLHRSALSMASLGHYHCDCPTTVEQRVENRRQRPLVVQLAESAYHVPQNGNTTGGNSSHSKPGSKLPGNLQRPDELLTKLDALVVEYADLWDVNLRIRAWRMPDLVRGVAALANDREPDDVRDLVRELATIVRQARLHLGYDHDRQYFANMLCPCGGALTVERIVDTGTEVRCAGTPDTRPCGTRYPWWTWADIAKGDE